MSSCKRCCFVRMLTFHSKLKEPSENTAGRIKFFECILPQVVDFVPPSRLLLHRPTFSPQQRCTLYSPPPVHTALYLSFHPSLLVCFLRYTLPAFLVLLVHVCIRISQISGVFPWFSLNIYTKYIPQPFPANEVSPGRGALLYLRAALDLWWCGEPLRPGMYGENRTLSSPTNSQTVIPESALSGCVRDRWRRLRVSSVPRYCLPLYYSIPIPSCFSPFETFVANSPPLLTHVTSYPSRRCSPLVCIQSNL